MRTHTCLSLNHLFHGITCGRRSVLDILLVQLLGTAGLSDSFRHHHFAQLLTLVEQLDLQRLLSLRSAQHTRLGLVTNHGELNLHTVSTLQCHAEFSLQVRHGHLSLFPYRHSGQLYRVVVLVGHLTLQRKTLCLHTERCQEQTHQDEANSSYHHRQ